MKKCRVLFVVFIASFCVVYGQQIKTDSTKNHFITQPNNADKIQLQQKLLLSRKNQLELVKQEQQKILLEKQKQQLAEKEKQLLELQIRSKQKELEQDRKTQTQVLRQNQMQAQLNAAIKDKQINAQQTEIGYNRKWNLFLLIGFVIVAVFALITYLAQRKAKRLNAVISSQHAELEQMGMVKDTILGVVSHDLRTPVNTLLAFSELFRDGDITTDKLKLYLDQINLTLNHTSSLMNNLLNWAASQMQGFKTVIEQIDVSPLAENMIASFADRASAKKIMLSHKIAAGTIVQADRNMLDLVLRNLVSNAIKYTAASGSVNIEACKQGEEIILSVTDTGMGMTDENRKLFNAAILSSSKSTPGTAHEKGTGLGLLLCKTFTRLMNGHINVQQNKEGKGSRFELVLRKGDEFTNPQNFITLSKKPGIG
jgi:signal transduction histidine kinase